MNKTLQFLGTVLLIMLQSCSMTTETVLHKDAATSTDYHIDFREMLMFAKSMGGDSANTNQKFGELEKLPTVWTSLFDVEKNEGKKSPTDKDSIRLMKKMFVKAAVEEGEFVGISIRHTRFTAEDYKFLDKGVKKNKLPVNNNLFKSWNGKTLTINTENLNADDFEKMMADGDDSKGKTPAEINEENKMLADMMQITFTGTLKFENKIKSISGLHDWIEKIDDHTIKVTYDTEKLSDKNTILKNKDSKIVITTE